MEEEHTKEPSHNNPEEAANYVKAVNTLSRCIQELSTHFIPASFKIRQRIFHQYGHRSCT